MPRKKGTPNKITRETRELLQTILEGELDHISNALLRLRGENPFGYLKTLTGLLPYILPKCTELESEVKEKKPLTWFTDQNPFE